MKFKCHNCNRDYNVREELIGKTVSCKDCGISMEITGPDNEDTSTHGDIKLQGIKNKLSMKKIVIIGFSSLLVFVLGFYFYSLLNQNKNVAEVENIKNDTIAEGNMENENISLLSANNDSSTTIDNVLENIDYDFNYLVNMSGLLVVNKKGSTETGSIEIGDLKFLSFNKGLRVNFGIGKLLFKTPYEEIKLENTHIITDNEKVYLKNFEGLQSVIYALGLHNFQKNDSEGNIMIDNSIPIKNILGELGNNELLTDIITGVVTSNPEEYFKKNNVNEKLIKFLQTDNIIQYLFNEGIKNETTSKIELKFNENICNDFSSIINSYFQEIYILRSINFYTFISKKSLI